MAEIQGVERGTAAFARAHEVKGVVDRAAGEVHLRGEFKGVLIIPACEGNHGQMGQDGFLQQAAHVAGKQPGFEGQGR